MNLLSQQAQLSKCLSVPEVSERVRPGDREEGRESCSCRAWRARPLSTPAPFCFCFQAWQGGNKHTLMTSLKANSTAVQLPEQRPWRKRGGGDGGGGRRRGTHDIPHNRIFSFLKSLVTAAAFRYELPFVTSPSLGGGKRPSGIGLSGFTF